MEFNDAYFIKTGKRHVNQFAKIFENTEYKRFLIGAVYLQNALRNLERRQAFTPQHLRLLRDAAFKTLPEVAEADLLSDRDIASKAGHNIFSIKKDVAMYVNSLELDEDLQAIANFIAQVDINDCPFLETEVADYAAVIQSLITPETLILIGIGESMDPFLWLTTGAADIIKKQNPQQPIYYYGQNFGDYVNGNQYLTNPLETKDVVPADAPCLIISDIDLIRNQQIIQQNVRGLNKLKKLGVTMPVTWINPRPKQRWEGTSAEIVQHLDKVTMTPMAEPLLFQRAVLHSGDSHCAG